jgi:hypothetical protein
VLVAGARPRLFDASGQPVPPQENGDIGTQFLVQSGQRYRAEVDRADGAEPFTREIEIAPMADQGKTHSWPLFDLFLP